MAILTTCRAALITITLTLRTVPLKVSYVLDYSRSNAESLLPIFAASLVKHAHPKSYLCSKLFHLLFKLLRLLMLHWRNWVAATMEGPLSRSVCSPSSTIIKHTRSKAVSTLVTSLAARSCLLAEDKLVK